MSYSVTLPLAKMYERTSKKGNVYFSGRMGMVNVVLFKTDEVSETGQNVWILKVSEPHLKADQRDLVGRPLDEKTETIADRGWQRDELEDPVPF